jgi:hypothetical protein
MIGHQGKSESPHVFQLEGAKKGSSEWEIIDEVVIGEDLQKQPECVFDCRPSPYFSRFKLTQVANWEGSNVFTLSRLKFWGFIRFESKLRIPIEQLAYLKSH